MKYSGIALQMAAAVLLLSAMAHSQKGSLEGQGHAIVTVLPAHPAEQDANVTMGQLQVKVAGKEASVTGWTPLKGADSRLELVLLIDGSARASLGEQLSDIANFAKEIPSNAKFAVAYMQCWQARCRRTRHRRCARFTCRAARRARTAAHIFVFRICRSTGRRRIAGRGARW